MSQSSLKAFGESQSAQLTDDSATHVADIMSRIDGADITMTGDKAKVHYQKSGDSSLELSRMGDVWKVPMSELSDSTDSAAIDRRLEELKLQTRIINALSDEIAAGRHKNADAAREAWRGKILQILPAHPPSNPTTAPARPTL